MLLSVIFGLAGWAAQTRIIQHCHWFYIAANELKSRASFGLLNALFESVVGNVPGAKPLLTLPVKKGGLV